MTESNLIQVLTNDFTNGFKQIPVSDLTNNNKQLAQIVANNVISTLKTTGTPQQQDEMSKLPQKDQMHILEQSLGNALGVFYLENKKIISDEDEFFTQVATIVLTEIVNNENEKKDLIQDAYNDIINGFKLIPASALTINNKQLPQIVASNIINTLATSGTPQQNAEISRLPPSQQLHILQKSVGEALAVFYLQNKKIITDEDGFFTQVATIVLTTAVPIIMKQQQPPPVADHVNKVVSMTKSKVNQPQVHIHRIVSNAKTHVGPKYNYFMISVLILIFILLVRYIHNRML
jgi:hypothetical protein